VRGKDKEKFYFIPFIPGLLTHKKGASPQRNLSEKTI
jgi:hypothetical protein